MAAASAEKKPSFFSKLGNFFKGVWRELKKVHWPTKKELITYTEVVLVAVVVIAAAIWVVDSIIAGLFGLVF